MNKRQVQNKEYKAKRDLKATKKAQRGNRKKQADSEDEQSMEIAEDEFEEDIKDIEEYVEDDVVEDGDKEESLGDLDMEDAEGFDDEDAAFGGEEGDGPPEGMIMMDPEAMANSTISLSSEPSACGRDPGRDRQPTTPYEDQRPPEGVVQPEAVQRRGEEPR